MRELIWLQHLFSEILPDFDKIPEFRMNNQSAIKLIKNPVFHKRTKHIDIRYKFISKAYEDKLFVPKYVSSKERIADILAKALPRNTFENLRNKMNIKSK